MLVYLIKSFHIVQRNNSDDTEHCAPTTMSMKPGECTCHQIFSPFKIFLTCSCWHCHIPMTPTHSQHYIQQPLHKEKNGFGLFKIKISRFVVVLGLQPVSPCLFKK